MIVHQTLNYNASRYATDDKADIKEVDRDLKRIYDCLQGRVRFGNGNSDSNGENIDGQWKVISDTGTINTEFSLSHSLGSIPVGYLVTKINKGGVIYDSGTAWTSTNIYLKCSAANATVSIFLLQ